MIEIAYDVKNADGVSEKELNLKKTHKIPLGSLVEISCDYVEEHGCRLFVVNHSRDCDGTPLYDLSFDVNAQKRLTEIEDDLRKERDNYAVLMSHMIRGMIVRHFSEDSLILVR
jgi:hypothetical protein